MTLSSLRRMGRSCSNSGRNASGEEIDALRRMATSKGHQGLHDHCHNRMAAACECKAAAMRRQVSGGERKRSLALKSSVTVAAERGARRRHGGCASSLGERRDRDQRDQGERGNEFSHDTSPFCGTLSSVFLNKLLKAARYHL